MPSDQSASRALLFSVRCSLANLMKEGPPNVCYRHAKKMTQLQGGRKRNISLVLLNFVQGRHRDPGPIRYLLQG